MIEITVDWNRCQHYGQCTYEAPDVFHLNEAGTLEHTATADDAEFARIEAAVDVCPMQALSFVQK